MILLIESDKTIRKKLCDLLSRERIIGVDTIPQTLETIVKHKNKLNLIIADIHLLREIISNQILFRLYQKLSIAIPPIVGFYKNGDEKIKEEFEKNNRQYKFIKYNEKDYSFPGQYIETIKEVYPEVHADIEKAREVWLKEKETEDLIDIRKWIEEEGFLIEEEKEGYIDELREKQKKKIEKEIKNIKELGLFAEEPGKGQKIEQKTDEKGNYKKMYFELKQKYDELLTYVKDLIDFSEKG